MVKNSKAEKITHIGKLLGFSKENSSQVGFICNLNKQWISPQYHVVYDDKFDTVPSTERQLNVDVFTNDYLWDELFEKGCYQYIEGELNEKGILLQLPELHKDCILREGREEQK